MISSPHGSAHDDHWWNHITTSATHTPIRELITGVDQVATHPIPYARLPRRLRTVFAAEFTSWADIADQTLQSLLDRPKIDDVAVRALITAAENSIANQRTVATSTQPVGATAAVRRLLDDLDERDRIILSARLWAAHPQTTRAVAKHLGVHSVSVERGQPRAEARFAELLADPLHHEISAYVDELRQRLGPYAPAELVAEHLRCIEVDPSSETAHVLLHLAGPYNQRDRWFENTAAGGRQQVAATVDVAINRHRAPSTAQLTAALTALGMPPHVATSYLDEHQPALRRFGDRWVRWSDSTADKAEAVLHLRGIPAAPEDILAALDPDDPATLRSLRTALHGHARFIRATRRTYGLRDWEISEYTGIYDEIAARIDASGGTIGLDELIDDLMSRFPDISEKSVRSYVAAPGSITKAGTVRRRTKTDKRPPTAPLHTARGAFRNGHNEIRLAVPVTNDILRGSGLQIPPPVANALGVNPGLHRVFTNPHGLITVAWRLSSTSGPSISSLRLPAIATAAALTDTLVLAFRLQDDSLDIIRIGAETTGIHRLRRLLGRTVRSPATALAASLGCPRSDIVALLRRQGDADLANLVD